MDISEMEENLFSASDAKLHGGMCKILSAIYCSVVAIFPSLEAARPQSKSGIQALCSLRIALEKTKNILQHCSESSKLYLAITGDSVVVKFGKARSALADSLRRIEGIVSQDTACQISEFLSELEGTVFILDSSEKQIGDEIIALLQKERKFDVDCNDNSELESFHQAALKLGITSSRAAVAERRALKKLVERARVEEDKRKESIVAYLLHLMRKYSKLFRSEFSDDNDSQGSGPCSPMLKGSVENIGGPGSNGQAYERQFSKLSSFNFKPASRISGHMPLPPEELRCPISLQLMYDPVIISSGQTYERICIEKWFSDGHNTCPKTQQQLSHLCLTPNYCVKGLIASWCEQNGNAVPDGPPASLDLNYWRLALSETESLNSKSMDSIKSKGLKVVPLEVSDIIEEGEGNEVVDLTAHDDELESNLLERYEDFLAILSAEQDLMKKCRVAETLRHLLKDDEAARNFLGAHGFVEALVRFLESTLRERNEMAQDIGAMALFNLALNNNRNKGRMLGAGILSLVEEMISQSNSHGSATALYLNLSCLPEAKPMIGLTPAVPFLVKVLEARTEPQCKVDALHALYNLSTHPSNISALLRAGVVHALSSLLAAPSGHLCAEKTIAVSINLASSRSGRDEMSSSSSLIGSLATVLDTGEVIEQEQAASCLLILCNGNEKCSELVLQEGVIPALVSISVNGTARGKEKAQKLLMLFREQRQRKPPSPPPGDTYRRPSGGINNTVLAAEEQKSIHKTSSRRKMKVWSAFWKNKSVSTYQC